MRSNQITEITTFLHQAQEAAKISDWLEVNYYLQQLPIFTPQSKFENLQIETKEEILQLALAVLTSGDFQQKWNIVKIFPVIDTYAIPSLICLIEDEAVDTETKWFVARTLGHFKEQRVVISLASFLQSTQESDLIEIASASLAQIGILAVETLINLLKKPNYRLVAAKSLAHIRLIPVLPALLELAKDENPEIRLLAIEALGSFHEEQIPPVLIKALKDSNSMVRKEAVIAIGFCADLCDKLNLVTHLQPLLYDLNLDVCRQAAISLGRMQNQESATKALNQALRSPHTPLSLKLDLVKALAWSETSLALDYLETASKIENDLVCQEIILVLGRITSSKLKPQAIRILIDFWHSAAPQKFEIKKVLAIALGELQAVEARVILEQLANDETKMVKLYAIASLKKLALIS